MAKGPLTAQECPYNLDFETGSFTGWTCYTGSVSASSGRNVISLNSSGGPVPGYHTMFSSRYNGGVDPYGGFPVNCPNGSGNSIKLGNDRGGGEAEGVSYEFTIPADDSTYTLIYHYAVVFQDPNHFEYQQPRMEIEITNITDNKLISCSSFTFIPFGTVLPGFFVSPLTDNSNTPVWCKNWSAVSINLDGHAGKRIRLFFKTADCTFQRHFGYAYIDVNSECSGEFLGATFCPEDSAVNVVAPYGYQNYTWYDSTFTKVLGNNQTLVLSPPPISGSTVAVKVEPFSGYGCSQTLYARFADTLSIQANAGLDRLSCNREPVQIGGPPKPGVLYSWSPATGLAGSQMSNPYASPDTTITYILKANSPGGGCVDTDTVTVQSSIINSSLQLIGKANFCIGYGDSAVLKVQPTDSIQWFKNNSAIMGENKIEYRVKETGLYHALLMNNLGCRITTESQQISIENARPGITYPVQYAIINEPVNLQARKFGESVYWSPGTSLDSRTLYSPVFLGATEQLYTIAITTTAGCLTVDTQLVRTVKNVEIRVPTAFTPNSDGMNDVLRPTLMGIKELHYFKVYNRWGELLYETNTERQGWDGKIKGLQHPPGAVVWIVEGLGLDGKVYLRKGSSVVVR